MPPSQLRNRLVRSRFQRSRSASSSCSQVELGNEGHEARRWKSQAGGLREISRWCSEPASATTGFAPKERAALEGRKNGGSTSPNPRALAPLPGRGRFCDAVLRWFRCASPPANFFLSLRDDRQLSHQGLTNPKSAKLAVEPAGFALVRSRSQS